MPRTETNQSLMMAGVLADLPTAKDQTTSMMLVNNPLLRVVYFSFDAGQELTNHMTPRAVVVTVLSGALDFTIGATTERLVPGDVVYLPPEREHALAAAEPTKISLVMVDVDDRGFARK